MSDTVDRKIRVGVIGGGLISQAVHLPTLAMLPTYFTLSALAEPSTSVREALACRYDIEARYGDWQTLIAASDIDAVVIASPNALHAPALLAALERGLHCFVEKPICVNHQEIPIIENAAREAQRVVQVGYNKRFDDAIAALVSDLSDEPELPLYADALTYDPGLARYFPTGALLPTPDDLPERAVRELQDAEMSQVAAAIGEQSLPDELRRVFIDIYLGALVHDINLLAWFAEVTGAGPMTAVGSRLWPGKTGAHAWGTFHNGAPWSSTWALTPDTHDFRESLRVLLPTGPRELELDGPYGGVKRRASKYVKRVAGRVELREHLDRSFENELVGFAAAVHGQGPPRNTIARAGADVELLTDLFRLGLQDVRDHADRR
jgi:predicted dehydrogenase